MFLDQINCIRSKINFVRSKIGFTEGRTPQWRPNSCLHFQGTSKTNTMTPPMDSGVPRDAFLQSAQSSEAGKTSNSPNAASHDGCFSVQVTDKDNAGQRWRQWRQMKTDNKRGWGQRHRTSTTTTDNKGGWGQGRGITMREDNTGGKENNNQKEVTDNNLSKPK